MGAGHRIYKAQSIHLVPEELYPHRLVGTAQVDIHCVSAHTERAALELGLGSVVQALDESVQKPRQAAGLALADSDRLRVEILRVADTVEA